MKVYKCYICEKKISRNEKGINIKLLGDEVREFLCLSCLAKYLEVTEEDILEKIKEFKEEGCKLFT